MPKIEQLDWSKLKPKTPEIKSTASYHFKPKGTKDFKEVQYVRSTKNAPKGYVKKRKRTKLIDRSIISEDITKQRHLRSIIREADYDKP